MADVERVARQRSWAASSSLNAIANPRALEPGPLVTRVLARTGEKVDSIGIFRRAKSWLADQQRCVADGVLDAA